MIRLLGIDPGLRFTGWGIIEAEGNRLRHLADGVIATDSAMTVPERLKALHDALALILAQYRPQEAAVEETYVNRNGTATLKLGYARGVALLAPALSGVPVTEYAAKSVKMAVVGTGGADKAQVQPSVAPTLPTPSRLPSVTHITAPATRRGISPREALDRPAYRSRRRARGRPLHHRCQRCWLSGPRLFTHFVGAACVTRGGAGFGGDARAR